MTWPDALTSAAVALGIAWYVTEQIRSETQLELQRKDLEARAKRISDARKRREEKP